ncbi:hypothetical protein WBG78_15350 [Chryseolinea sp. T2]|uniref:hypothetical protein n=1 Tax=Chryseolinea sp. T2 TaxID=3129255 RepID=UPI003077A157
MKPKKDEQKKDVDQRDNTNIVTPAPPQVIDPSRPPGSGRHETYRKDDQKENKEKPRGSSPGTDRQKRD